MSGAPIPYEVLHLGRAAPAREVAHAYRALARAHHPDTRPAGTVSADPNAAAQELQELQETTPPPWDPGPSGPDPIIGLLQWEGSNLPAPGRRLLWWIQF